jgi:type I restriction enzyme, S subunit
MSKVVAKKVSELVDVFNNIRVPLSSKQRESLAKIYPYYGAQGIVDYVDNFLFDGEYILIAEDGENLKSNNQNICNIVQGKFWVNNHAHIVRANQRNFTKYLYYNFNRIKFEPYVTGSSQPKLNKENLLNIKVYVHDNLPTQKSIAKVLSDLDTKIELNNRINRELEAMAKTLYDYWFVQFDFPNEQGKPYKSSGGKMVYNAELKREIPEGWEVKKLAEIANITMGQSPEGSSYNDDGIGEIFFQGSTDFGWRYPTIRQYTTQPSRRAKAGDILLSVRAPVGTLNIADNDCCIGRGLAALNSKSGYDSYLFYVMEYFKQIFDHRNNTGTTFGSITKDDLFSLKLVYPKDDQLNKYNHLVAKYNQMILNNYKQNQQLSLLRDWLLPMLMNGQVTVKEAEERLSMAAEPSVEYKTN